MIVLHAIAAGLLQAVSFLWGQRTMHRYMGPNPRGIL